MDFVMVLFLFILPLCALVVSLYSLYHIMAIKKVAAKVTALCRITGKDRSDG